MQTNPISFDAPGTVTDWLAINDAVMGGLSTGRFRYDPAGHAVFEGEVSLERNGGFASVRGARRSWLPWHFGYALSVLGRRQAVQDEPAYRGHLRRCQLPPTQPQAGQWIEVRVPLSAFVPNFRGRPVPGEPPLNPALVRQVGLMIAGKQAGLFRLCVRRISAY